MKEDEDAFYHRKSFSKKGIEKDADCKECKHEKSSMPLLGDVGVRVI